MIEINRDGIRETRESQGAYDALYARAFSGEQTGQTPSRYLWLMELVDGHRSDRGATTPSRRPTLLDVSSGNGYLLQAADQHGWRAMGLELSPVGIRQTALRASGTPVVCGDAEALPFAVGAFDCVTNIGSVEHYRHPAQSVAEMARVLAPDGLALILVPNAYGLVGNIQYVWRHGDVFLDEQPIQRYGTRGAWQRLLEANGLRVERVVGYDREWPRTWADFRHLLRRPLKLVRAALGRLIPVNLADSLVFLCRRAAP